jgi:hypothetical protein
MWWVARFCIWGPCSRLDHKIYMSKRNNPWSDFIRIWFPNSTILIVDDNLSPSIVQQGMLVWFSDIDPPRSLQLWDSDALVILSQRRARHVPRSVVECSRYQYGILHVVVSPMEAGHFLFTTRPL